MGELEGHIMREGVSFAYYERSQWKVCLSHIIRETNFAADFLAEFAMEFPLGFHKLEGVSEDLLPWMNHDKICVSYPRLLLM